MIEINLLPGSQGKSKRRRGFAPAALFGSLGEQLTDRYLLGTVGAVIVAVAAVAAMFTLQARQQDALEARQLVASRDSARFAAVLAARSHAETTRDSVYQQLAIIKSIDDSRFTWPHLLEEINLAIPPYTWLSGVTQTSAVITTAAADSDTVAAGKPKTANVSKKPATAKDSVATARRKRAHADSLFKGDGSVTKFRIIGQTVDIQALTLFMKNLEASPFIKNVQLTRSDLVTTDNKEVTEFQLEAETEIPPPSMIETVPLSVAVH